ncbi:MAG: polymorphic toxin-type HINT domain-containing protein [bacterium]
MVLSKDPLTGEVAYKEVTHLYTNDKVTTYEIYIDDEIIQTTDNHPFWVKDKGWVLSLHLAAGDQLQVHEDQYVAIDRVEVVNHDVPVKVYNFTVEDYHTYYVSELGIWVHNISCNAKLRKEVGPPPEAMHNAHAHHIVPKGNYSNRSKIAQSYLKYSRKVLKEYGIGINDIENLIWAPNKGHTDAYFKKVAKELFKAKKNKVSREEMIQLIQEIGKQFASTK